MGRSIPGRVAGRVEGVDGRTLGIEPGREKSGPMVVGRLKFGPIVEGKLGRILGRVLGWLTCGR